MHFMSAFYTNSLSNARNFETKVNENRTNHMQEKMLARPNRLWVELVLVLKEKVFVKKGLVLYCFVNDLLPGSLQNGSVKHKCDLLFFAFNINRLKTFLFPFLIKFEINNNSLSFAQ